MSDAVDTGPGKTNPTTEPAKWLSLTIDRMPMQKLHFAVVAPCFNEGEVVDRFLSELASVLGRTEPQWTVVVVDDASTDDTLVRARAFVPQAANVAIHPISLAYNMGHQEAIYQGLLYASTLDATRFVVIDGDGEDDPLAITELVEVTDSSIVFVARGKRSESLFFKLGYRCYRVLFKVITGRGISFGNYSMIDRRVLNAVLDRAFIHYAAFLSRQRVTSRIITYDRRKRIDGRSKMSFRSLSLHAFGSLIEYSEQVLFLFLRAFLAMAVVFLLSLFAIVGIKLFTTSAVPGWASTLSVSLFNSMLICLGFLVTGLLLVNTAHRRDRARRHLYERSPSGKELP